MHAIFRLLFFACSPFSLQLVVGDKDGSSARHGAASHGVLGAGTGVAAQLRRPLPRAKPGARVPRQQVTFDELCREVLCLEGVVIFSWNSPMHGTRRHRRHDYLRHSYMCEG